MIYDIFSVVVCYTIRHIVSSTFNTIYKKINQYICYSKKKHVHLQQKL